jgi:hypothetical protein
MHGCGEGWLKDRHPALRGRCNQTDASSDRYYRNSPLACPRWQTSGWVEFWGVRASASRSCSCVGLGDDVREFQASVAARNRSMSLLREQHLPNQKRNASGGAYHTLPREMRSCSCSSSCNVLRRAAPRHMRARHAHHHCQIRRYCVQPVPFKSIPQGWTERHAGTKLECLNHGCTLR